jgi:hypothetical protein
VAVKYRDDEDASLTRTLFSCVGIAGSLSDAHLVSYTDSTFFKDLKDFDQCVRRCNMGSSSLQGPGLVVSDDTAKR